MLPRSPPSRSFWPKRPSLCAVIVHFLPLPYSLFAATGAWRSADRYEGNPFHAAAAKIALIIWIGFWLVSLMAQLAARMKRAINDCCAMSQSLHDAKIDPRNQNILISVNGKLFPRAEAVVSVFDSGFILGDGVWEGLRLVNGGVPFLHAHIERLYEGAKAIFMDIGLSPETGEAPLRLP